MTKPPAESYLRQWLCHFGYIILIFSQGSPALPGCDIDTTCIFTVLDTLFSFTMLLPKKEQLSPIKAKYSAPILFVILI